MKYILIALSSILFACIFNAHSQTCIELERYKSIAARQAVAVDKNHFYAINNHHIVKYSLSGDSITEWKDSIPNSLLHLNSGVVIDRKLYCAHSNYPELPMVSSIEVFDNKTMRHIESISFGIEYGSCTWIEKGDGCWYVFFAQYENKSQEKGKTVAWSQLIRFDKQWRKTQAWVLPKALVEKVRPYSISGGILINHTFYCTGHDAQECYLLTLPQSGSTLKWTNTIAVPFHGQGISQYGNYLWGIDRKKREVIKTKLEQ